MSDSSIVAVALASCALCTTHVKIGFTAGSSWKEQRADLLHLASGDAPSTLLPENYFRTGLERSTRRLRKSDPSDREGIILFAGDGIRDLREIRKFQRAAGGDLSPADRDLLVMFAKAYVSAGKTLPDDLRGLIP